jgi:hypothetical protein
LPGTHGRERSAKTFGHSGATGTIAWADLCGTGFAWLTTLPLDASEKAILKPVCELV